MSLEHDEYMRDIKKRELAEQVANRIKIYTRRNPESVVRDFGLNVKLLPEEGNTWLERRNATDLISLFSWIIRELKDEQEQFDAYGPELFPPDLPHLGLTPDAGVILHRQQIVNWNINEEEENTVSLQQVLAQADRSYYKSFMGSLVPKSGYTKSRVDELYTTRELVSGAIMIEPNFQFTPKGYENITNLRDPFMRTILNRKLIAQRQNISSPNS